MKMVLIEELQNGMVVAQDVFTEESGVTPIIRCGIVLNDYVISHIKKRGITSIYIEGDTAEDLSAAQDDAPKSPPAISPELQKEALSSIEEIFHSAAEGDSPAHAVQMISHLDSVVDQLVNSLTREEKALVNINDLKSYDDYTYHHSLSVAVLSIAMGQYLGLNGDNLNRLGTSAIMHDIGKTAIPVELIRKASKLTPEEFGLIKTHSTAGYEYLTKNKIGDTEIWQGVLYHHERVDGSGYPNRLRGVQIPKWSRIISVADVYDALTSNRPYREPMPPADAMEYIMGGIGSSFDYNMVTALYHKVDLYPVGCKVELSNGFTATVMDNKNQLRPVVRIEPDGDTIDLYRDRHFLSVVIRRTIDPNNPSSA